MCGLNLYMYSHINKIAATNKIFKHNRVFKSHKINWITSNSAISHILVSKVDNINNTPEIMNEQSIDNQIANKQTIEYDYSEHPEFNLSTSYEIAREYAENGLPDNRTYEGVWFELVAHYVVHKIDFLDITDADDIANIGNFENDTNAWFWELCMNLFGNIFFD